MSIATSTRWQRWVAPPVLLILTAALLTGITTIATQVPGFGFVNGPQDSTFRAGGRPGTGDFSPLRPGFISQVLGFLIPGGSPPNVVTALTGAAGQPNGTAGGQAVGLGGSPSGTVVDHPFTNRSFASAYPVGGLPFTGKTSQRGGSRQAGDPTSCAPVGGEAWYRYTAPTDQGLFANTFGTSFTTALAVFQGADLTHLRQLGCDTNAQGNSQVGFAARRGATYYFQITAPVQGGDLVFSLAPVGATLRASVDSRGHQLSSASPPLGDYAEDISADGRWIAFITVVDAGQRNLQLGTCRAVTCSAVYLRDQVSGTSTLVASTSSMDQSYAGGYLRSNVVSCCSIDAVSLSADGRFVVFDSNASNLTPGPSNGEFQIYAYDRVSRRTEKVSVNSAGQEAATCASTRALAAAANYSTGSFGPAISANGRFVVFGSTAANFGGSCDASHLEEVYIRDRWRRRTTEISFAPTGAELQALSFPGNHSISADGRFVAMQTSAGNLGRSGSNCLPAAGCTGQVLLRDVLAGITHIVSAAPSGELGDGNSQQPYISADGSHVAFMSLAANLVPHDTNGTIDAYEWTRSTRQLRRVSVSSGGGQQNDTSPRPAPLPASVGDVGFGNSSSLDRNVSLSGDGRYAAFDSAAPDLVPGANPKPVVNTFVHDLVTGSTVRVSVSSTGVQGNADSGSAIISEDGSVVAFQSDATNLVADDTNGLTDVFLHELGL